MCGNIQPNITTATLTTRSVDYAGRLVQEKKDKTAAKFIHGFVKAEEREYFPCQL